MTVQLFTVVVLVAGAGAPVTRKLEPVEFVHVRIDDAFWGPRLETNRTRTLPANFRQCESTGRFTNFAKAAGLMEGKFEGIYFNDSDVYKVLEGASYALAAQRDPALEKKVDDVIAWIAAAQQPNGYLNTYYTLVEPDKKWTDLRVRHELYCAGHLFEAAVAHHQATSKTTLLDVATRFADRIGELFGEDRMEGVPGHEEIELALIKLYHETGRERYLKLAQFFVEQRGRKRDEKLAYAQNHLPAREQSEVVGHAVRAMYWCSGVADLAAETGDAALLDACRRLWDSATNRKMYVTGGIGATRRGEAFGKDYELPNDAAYAETCAAIGLILFAHRMVQLEADAQYADVMERALYNGFLSGVSLDGEKFFYVNPLGSRGQHHRQPWYGCACCPTNVVRLLGSLGRYVYARSNDGVWVNLYVSNKAEVEVAGAKVMLVQKTDYPWSGRVQIAVNPAQAVQFNVNLRIPGWCRSATCRVNAVAVDATKTDKGYLRIARTWKPGDVVTLELAMPVERIAARRQVTANAGRVALQRGPLIYCLEGIDHDVPPRSVALPPEANLTTEHRADLLGGVTVLKGKGLAAEPNASGTALYSTRPAAKPVEITAVPYYAWDHRGPGQMVAWIPETVLLAEPVTAGTHAQPSASHVWRHDSASALNDGLEPATSDDHSIPRFTWWDHKGTTEWVAYTFAKPQRVSEAELYWFDDTPQGGCRLPKSWRLLCKDGQQWRPVTGASAYTTRPNEFNGVTFDPVETTALRIEVQLEEGFSAGILEWRIP